MAYSEKILIISKRREKLERFLICTPINDFYKILDFFITLYINFILGTLNLFVWLEIYKYQMSE